MQILGIKTKIHVQTQNVSAWFIIALICEKDKFFKFSHQKWARIHHIGQSVKSVLQQSFKNDLRLD